MKRHISGVICVLVILVVTVVVARPRENRISLKNSINEPYQIGYTYRVKTKAPVSYFLVYGTIWGEETQANQVLYSVGECDPFLTQTGQYSVSLSLGMDSATGSTICYLNFPGVSYPLKIEDMNAHPSIESLIQHEQKITLNTPIPLVCIHSSESAFTAVEREQILAGDRPRNGSENVPAVVVYIVFSDAMSNFDLGK